jgi:hypothetical protein
MKTVVLMALEDDLMDYGQCFWEVVDKYSEFSIKRIPVHVFYRDLYSPNTSSAFQRGLTI